MVDIDVYLIKKGVGQPSSGKRIYLFAQCWLLDVLIPVKAMDLRHGERIFSGTAEPDCVD